MFGKAYMGTVGPWSQKNETVAATCLRPWSDEETEALRYN